MTLRVHVGNTDLPDGTAVFVWDGHGGADLVIATDAPRVAIHYLVENILNAEHRRQAQQALATIYGPFESADDGSLWLDSSPPGSNFR